MSTAALWILSLAVVVLVGTAATLYIRSVLLRRDEAAAGIVALSAMSWREFINLVLDVLARRGYKRVIDREAPSSDGEYLLARGGDRWLLSCKHGSAFVLGHAAVSELADDIRLHGIAGGLLVTQGKIGGDAHAPAKLQHIELLDGPTLWPEMRGLIPAEQQHNIRAEAEQGARQRVLFAWLIALLAGIATFVVLPRAEPGPGPAGTTATDAAQPATPATTAVEAAAETPLAAVDEATLEQQRKDVANAISTLPMVDRAIWSTQSTLVVFLLETDSDAVAALCPLIERFPSLASSRIQLTPPEGSETPVRFRQCRSY